MTRTIYYTATTLDGFLADEHDSLDWLFRQDIDDAGAHSYKEFIAGIGAIVMGRTTYEWIRDHLAGTDGSWEYTVPSWVVTHADLPGTDAGDVRFAQGDVRPIHAAMVEAGLLDELLVSIAPVTLGTGRPLLPRCFDLELEDVVRNRAFICATYSVGGPMARAGPLFCGDIDQGDS